MIRRGSESAYVDVIDHCTALVVAARSLHRAFDQRVDRLEGAAQRGQHQHSACVRRCDGSCERLCVVLCGVFVVCGSACVFLHTWLHLCLAIHVGDVFGLAPSGLGDPDQAPAPPEQMKPLSGQVPGHAHIRLVHYREGTTTP